MRKTRFQSDFFEPEYFDNYEIEGDEKTAEEHREDEYSYWLSYAESENLI
jgi:hypothetical protein